MFCYDLLTKEMKKNKINTENVDRNKYEQFISICNSLDSVIINVEARYINLEIIDKNIVVEFGSYLMEENHGSNSDLIYLFKMAKNFSANILNEDGLVSFKFLFDGVLK